MGSSKYFVFNKKRDYLQGYRENVRITESGIVLDTDDPGKCGIFISRLLDGGREGNKWHRAVIQSIDYGDDSIRFSFYCSDSRKILYQDQLMEWSDLIGSAKWSAKEKHEAMRPFLVHQILNPRDVLLYQAKGRFLWIEIQLFCQANVFPQIQGMKIYAENRSFLQYLPEIYQVEPESDFLRRYLSLFESVYQDLDRKIRNAARQMEPETAEREFLHWMARWVGISEISLWPDEKLRILLNGIVKKNFIRGTKEYMKYIIETFTGETPFFVEYAEVEHYREMPDIYRRLRTYYAHDPYIVNVLIREQAVPTLQEQRTLKKIIDDMKPAHIEVHLVILRPYIYLNQNVYVGINSALGTYQKANLNSMTAIPSVVGMYREKAEARE